MRIQRSLAALALGAALIGTGVTASAADSAPHKRVDETVQLGSLNLQLNQTNTVDLPANYKIRDVSFLSGVLRITVEATMFDWYENGTNAVRVKIRAYPLNEGGYPVAHVPATYVKYLGMSNYQGVAYAVYIIP